MPPKRDAATLGEGEGGEAAQWADYNVVALKEELGRRELIKSGKKADLVARLVEDDNKQTNQSGLVNNEGSAEIGGHAIAPPSQPAPKKKRTKKEASPEVEVDGPLASEIIVHQHFSAMNGQPRPREFVPAPDAKFKDKLKRIRKERMFMIDRKMEVNWNGSRSETFDIAGSTGIIYQCTIGEKPRCDCMDARTRGQKCKHINYALIIILKAPIYMCYQLAFFPEELETIFANAPITQAPVFEHSHQEEETQYNGKRKPIDGHCPICVMDMEPGEELVWCKAACGQNFHKQCFDQWRRTKQGYVLTCVYCRTEWQEDTAPAAPSSTMGSIKTSAPKIGSYKNIGRMSMYQQGADMNDHFA